MSIFGDNIARLRADMGYSQRDLAKLVGVSAGTVAAWEARNTVPGIETLNRICAVLNVRGGDLFSDVAMSSREEWRPVDVPVFGHIAAGNPVDMEDSDFSYFAPAGLVKSHPHAFYLKVDGESMNRVLPNGSYALVDPDMREPVVDGRLYAVCVNGYSATVKRVKNLGNGVELVPDSTDPTFHSVVYDATLDGTDTITVIGEVVWYTLPFDWSF